MFAGKRHKDEPILHDEAVTPITVEQFVLAVFGSIDEDFVGNSRGAHLGWVIPVGFHCRVSFSFRLY
jgi:hypothetical protein